MDKGKALKPKAKKADTAPATATSEAKTGDKPAKAAAKKK